MIKKWDYKYVFFSYHPTAWGIAIDLFLEDKELASLDYADYPHLCITFLVWSMGIKLGNVQ